MPHLEIQPGKMTLAQARQVLQEPVSVGLPNSADVGIGKSVECVYSDEQLVYPGSDGEVCFAKPASGESTRLDCASGFGAATFVTGSFGFVAASRVLARLAKKAAAETTP